MNENKISNKKQKYIIISLITITISLIITFLVFALIIGKTNFSLIGDKIVEINVKEKYHDKGVKSTHCTITQCQNLNKNVTKKDNINTQKLGTYRITYILKYRYKTYKLTRNVKVIDKEKPKITLNGTSETTVCPNQTYEEEGYSATDNYDGDLTDKVIVNKTKEKIIYKVQDSSKNIGKTQRTLNYKDEENPEITLNGSQTIYLEIDSPYNEPGYKVIDKCDGNLTDKVQITNNINNKKLGTYTVNYEVADNSGNKTTIQRKVIVTGVDKTNATSYISSLNNYIKQKGYKVSIGYYNLTTGYKYTYNPNALYYGASLIKTLDALYIYEKASNGAIDLNTNITLEPHLKRDYSLGMQNYSVGSEVNLKELVKYAITVSDNTAHAMLINYIGFNNLKSYGNSLGAKYTLVGKDNFGNTTVDDQIAYMKKLYNFTNTSSNGSELKGYFINNYYNYISFSGMPTFIHKYGHQGNVFHDAGIVLDAKPYIIVILSNGNYENRKDIFQDISKKIYDFHKTFQ